jgi:hypothetical protein
MLRSIATRLCEGLRSIRITNQHKYCIYRYLISRQRLDSFKKFDNIRVNRTRGFLHNAPNM